MIDEILLGIGCVAVIEGLVLALAPNRLEDIVTMLREIGPERLRVLGVCVMAFGVFVVWLARG